MRLKLIFALVFLFILKYSFAQNVTPVQIERSQELSREEDMLRQKVERPQKVFIKEIILPEGCLIPREEIENITSNFRGHWHSAKEIQELSDVFAKAYQKAYHSSKLPKTTYNIKDGKLFFSFK